MDFTKEYRVILVDMPIKIKGLVVKGDDDFYTIYLNSRLTYEENMKSFAHELKHIKNDDFNSALRADEIERLARRME